MDLEILIYLQKVMNYFTTNDEVKDYFIGSSDPLLFYSKVKDQSIKNFTERGDPMLTKEEFEEIRKGQLVVEINTLVDDIFIDLKHFGKICLN